MREIQILNNHPELQIDETALEECIRILDTWGKYSVTDGELSLVFPDQEEMCRLHDEFLSDPKLTDVITFDGDPLLEFGGEIFASADQAQIQAPHFNNDFSSELTLYVVHGWLHLAGLDDRAAETLKVMKDAEQEAMGLLGKPLSQKIFRLNSEA